MDILKVWKKFIETFLFKKFANLSQKEDYINKKLFAIFLVNKKKKSEFAFSVPYLLFTICLNWQSFAKYDNSMQSVSLVFLDTYH